MGWSIDWLVSINDFRPIWEHQPVFLLTQCLFLFGGLCTLKHALSNGGRWPLLWLVIVFNGILLEVISTSVPNLCFFWHSQGPVMVFGKSVAFGILFFYPCVYYTSLLSASFLRLPRLYEALAAGVIAEIINFPVDFIGLKYLQYTWHDSEPSLLDRTYSVPWNGLCFHLLHAFTQSFLFNINQEDVAMSRRKLSQGSLNWKMFLVNITLPIPILFALFAIFYHALHDFLGVHTQITFLLTFCPAIGLVWSAYNARDEKYFKHGIIGKISQKYIVIFLVLYYSFFLSVPVLFDPENVVTTGPRQPIGPCEATEPVHTLLGKVLERKKYICWKHQNQEHFDFHCVPRFVPGDNEIISEYTICGTSFQNKAEFISIIVGNAIVAFCIVKSIFFSARSSSSDKERKKV